MIGTSIEQSRRLLSLGLDPMTADMTWTTHDSGGRSYSLETRIDVSIRENLFSFREGLVIPSWSFHALAKLIPHTGFYGFELNNYNDGKEFYTAKFEGANEYTLRLGEDPITVMFEVVVYLIENNIIVTNHDSE